MGEYMCVVVVTAFLVRVTVLNDDVANVVVYVVVVSVTI